MLQQCVRLRLRRQAARVSQVQLSGIIGYNVMLLRKWENHKKIPNARQFREWESAVVRVESGLLNVST